MQRAHQTVRIALCVFGLTVAIRAQAADGEVSAGGMAGVDVLSGRGVGPALGLDAVYGLGDMLDVRLELEGSHHESGADVLGASLGLAYKLDVLSWVPYAGLSGGYYHFGGPGGADGIHGGVPGASAELGVDYLLSRELSAGVEVHGLAALHDGLKFPLYGAMLEAAYRWGF